MENTKVDILKDLCLKVTGVASTGDTIVEVLEDIYANYNSDGSIPTKVSQLTNDSGFITESDIPVAANQAEAEAAGDSDDVVKLEDFNALLTKLKAAGIMEADSE